MSYLPIPASAERITCSSVCPNHACSDIYTIKHHQIYSYIHLLDCNESKNKKTKRKFLKYIIHEAWKSINCMQSHGFEEV